MSRKVRIDKNIRDSSVSYQIYAIKEGALTWGASTPRPREIIVDLWQSIVRYPSESFWLGEIKLEPLEIKQLMFMFLIAEKEYTEGYVVYSVNGYDFGSKKVNIFPPLLRSSIT